MTGLTEVWVANKVAAAYQVDVPFGPRVQSGVAFSQFVLNRIRSEVTDPITSSIWCEVWTPLWWVLCFPPRDEV